MHPTTPPEKGSGQHDAWNAAMALPRALNRYNARIQHTKVRLSTPLLFGSEDPVSFLARIRPSQGEIGRQHAEADNWLRISQRSSAVLFLFAVAAYEGYTEIDQSRTCLLIVYLAGLLATGMLAWVVRKTRLQRRTEDYRGVQEMLRVQIAWWGAGINRMVDRAHLRTTDSDLRLVREAAGAIVVWALLRYRPAGDDRTGSAATSLDIRDIYGVTATSPVANLPRIKGDTFYYKEWIEDQVGYFATKSYLQRQITHLVELTFGTVLTAAIFALSGLVAILAGREWFGLTWNVTQTNIAIAAPLMLMPCSLGCLVLLGWALCGKPPRGIGAKFGSIALARLVAETAPGPLLAVAAALILAAATLVASCALTLVYGYVGATIPFLRTDWVGWVGLGALLVGVGLSAFVVVEAWKQGLDRRPDKRVAFAVRELWMPAKLAAALLLAFTMVDAAAAIAAVKPQAGAEAMSLFLEALDHWLLASSVLLLAGAGMTRWYSERRNHLAQATRYDDLLRAFRRAQDLVRQHGPLNYELCHHLRSLGEMALNENEAWLKAHRDRPLEPMAGA